MHRFIRLAAEVARPRNDNDLREYWLGAVGIRADGVLVSAQNGSVMTTVQDGKGFTFPAAHAERRCSKKMDVGGTVYVARVLSDGSLAMSKPCVHCEGYMRTRGIKKVYYSINDVEYGVLDLT